MKLPPLKHRKPIVYTSLGIYLFLVGVIIFESCLPSGASGQQSNLFARISAWFINSTTEPIVPKSINPTEILEVTDSTYLGQDEQGVSNIVVGTTSLVSIPVQYPNKEDKYDEYNYQYSLDYKSGNKNDYDVVLSSRTGQNNTYIIDMRIVANTITDSTYQIDVNIAQTLTYSYKFHIIDMATPTQYESKISKTTFKIGESVKVDTKLLGEDKTDAYLRRYFDESKISRSSLNESVATIDSYGVIHAVSEGTTTIKYGKYDFPITVSNEHITKPATNTLILSVNTNSKAQPSLLDYDYVFNGENDNEYSTLIYASYLDTSLEDQSVSWSISDNQKAKLSPYRYDDNGYPIYVDDLNKPCVRVTGYRQKGDITINCYSNNDNTINNSLTLTVDEAIPTSMDINIKDSLSLKVNEQKVISVTFAPKNVNNKKIHIDVDNTDIVVISNNDSSSVTISGNKVGTAHITITSLANSSLKKEYDVTFTAKDKINDDNYQDFHQFIRKASGHLALFLVTAVFGILFFYTYFDDIKKIWISGGISFLLGISVAGISELIQYLMPTRSGLMRDVGIDSLGYLIGTLLTIGVIYLILFIKSKRSKKEEIDIDNKE
ncbi:MAG: VanZ family protein [Bacilli bacterium]|nr:VanZ family protein [Bacilli bacterium]